MTLQEELVERFREGLLAAFIPLFVHIFGTIMMELPAPTEEPVSGGLIQLSIGIFLAYPAILTLIALGATLAFGGPVGLIGGLFEVIGANLFFSQPSTAIWLILFGATIVVISTEVWKWEWLLDSSSGRR